MSVLVIDAGTSNVKAAVVRPDGSVAAEHRRATPPSNPQPTFVEIDPRQLAEAALDCARRALDDAGPVLAVGVTNQRASTIVWDRATGEPVGPGVGWQDLRTVMMCLVLQGQGLRIAPNASATKLAFLLDWADPDRTRDLCFGTVDSWLAWNLTGGAAHVTDLTNAAVTALQQADGSGWSDKVLSALNIPASVLPSVVDTSGVAGTCSALPGSPPLAALVGDQQASLVGQGCTRPGLAKITFGTGGMLDVCLGSEPPALAEEGRGQAGCFPIVAWRLGGAVTWGLEAIMLAAGSNVAWLVEDLGVLADPLESAEVAASVEDALGLVYVPALLGLGAPHWDYGARGTLLGLTRGAGRAHLVRAVLEGVAHRGADLVEAAEADGAPPIEALRIDGGMSANPTFVQALADATQRPVEVAPVAEATTLGAAYLAGLAAGVWRDLDETASLWAPKARVEPRRVLDRARWAEAVERARGWIPELSSVQF